MSHLRSPALLPHSAVAYAMALSLLILHSTNTLKLTAVTVCAAMPTAFVIEELLEELYARYLRYLVRNSMKQLEATMAELERRLEVMKQENRTLELKEKNRPVILRLLDDRRAQELQKETYAVAEADDVD